MINLHASYTNTPIADGALVLTANQNPNFSSAQTRNMPVEQQTPNRVSSPEQVAAAVKNPTPKGVNANSTGSLLDVRA
ncbi:hypothetical protein [Halothiobacillus sp.]|uniref:hypothetical protein n=1 Tax=Halothiobacillus sp. TaxID=1891311 RepID=UPI00262405CB|nr:hypothetical protein [Halothiobacillus sp.]